MHRRLCRTGTTVGTPALALGLALAIGLCSTMAGTGVAGAATAGPLRPLRCTPLSTDVPLQPPQYAQAEGAGGATDEWWCELPHATQLPASYVELKRLVAPLAYPYGLYSTYYAPRGSGSTAAAGQPVIVVTEDANGGVVRPGRLKYPATPSGKKIVLVKGVNATVTQSASSVSVEWRYPRSGVPRYLTGVATVTVSGTDVPESVVLGIARHVEPD